MVATRATIVVHFMLMIVVVVVVVVVRPRIFLPPYSYIPAVSLGGCQIRARGSVSPAGQLTVKGVRGRKFQLVYHEGSVAGCIAV
jgi:hypothetical protein